MGRAWFMGDVDWRADNSLSPSFLAQFARQAMNRGFIAAQPPTRQAPYRAYVEYVA
jgi:hypothetical protein